MGKHVFGTAYEHHGDGRDGVVFPESDYAAKQSFAQDADVNVVVSRFLKTGVMPGADRVPQFVDLFGWDFQAAMDLQVAGRQMFLRLPPELRIRFQNDVATFYDFLADPANRDEAIELGLIKLDQKPSGVPARVPALHPQDDPGEAQGHPPRKAAGKDGGSGGVAPADKPGVGVAGRRSTDGSS